MFDWQPWSLQKLFLQNHIWYKRSLQSLLSIWKLRSCHGWAKKTSDFHTGCSRFKPWPGSCTPGQGALSSLPSMPYERRNSKHLKSPQPQTWLQNMFLNQFLWCETLLDSQQPCHSTVYTLLIFTPHCGRFIWFCEIFNSSQSLRRNFFMTVPLRDLEGEFSFMIISLW